MGAALEATEQNNKGIDMKNTSWGKAHFLLLAVVGLHVSLALAQDYPSKSIKFIVPFAAGSGSDQAARTYAQVISQLTGVPVIVEPKPGGNGFIAVQNVAKAQPDGYTALYTTNTTTNTTLYIKAADEEESDAILAGTRLTLPYLTSFHLFLFLIPVVFSFNLVLSRCDSDNCSHCLL